MSINKNYAIAAIGAVIIIVIAAVLIKYSPNETADPSVSPAASTIRKTGEISLGELANLSGCDTPVVPGRSAANYDSLAKCLTDKGVKMYGAWWCSHCQNQKKMFSGSFQYINYIECSSTGQRDFLEVCRKAQIKSYPTWEFPAKAQ